MLGDKVEELRKVSGASGSCGWMHDEVCWLLYGLIRFKRPEVVIQTGHLWGKSALFVLEALEDAYQQDDELMGDPEYARFVADNAPPDTKGKLISVDQEPNWASVNWLVGRYSNFVFFPMASPQYFDEARWGRERIFGIVDGDHTAAGAALDLKALAKLDADTILLDDTSFIPHLKNVGRSIGYAVTELPEYNGVMLLTRTP